MSESMPNMTACATLYFNENIFLILDFQGCAIDYSDLDLPNSAECVAVSTLNHMFGVFFDNVRFYYNYVLCEPACI